MAATLRRTNVRPGERMAWKNRHRSIRDQHHNLSAMMQGHYAYYGVVATIDD
jgi:hypothetical protein